MTDFEAFQLFLWDTGEVNSLDGHGGSREQVQPSVDHTEPSLADGLQQLLTTASEQP